MNHGKTIRWAKNAESIKKLTGKKNTEIKKIKTEYETWKRNKK
jgi:hypothetical protein